MAALPDEIASDRLRLVLLDAAVLAAMSAGGTAVGDGSIATPGLRGFSWPGWWPDADDLEHVQRWSERARSDDGAGPWGARAIVMPDGGGELAMIGHVGFHGPPVDIAAALDDPTFEGSADPAVAGVVEVGYTVFPERRGRGYASEAVGALVALVEQSAEVSTVLATVEIENTASVRVLERVGGFIAIGRCRGDNGVIETVFRWDASALR